MSEQPNFRVILTDEFGSTYDAPMHVESDTFEGALTLALEFLDMNNINCTNIQVSRNSYFVDVPVAPKVSLEKFGPSDADECKQVGSHTLNSHGTGTCVFCGTKRHPGNASLFV